ncbi:MAG: hypothetical protein R3F30_15900 [Planctomycetota bacterium]
MLSKDAIKGFTAKVVPFLSIMSLVPDRKDDQLLVDYGFNSFPTFAFLDAEGKLLLQLQGREQKDWEEAAARLARQSELRAKWAAGGEDKALAGELLTLGLELGNLELAEAEALAAKAELGDEERMRYEEGLLAILSRMKLDAARKEGKRLAEGFGEAFAKRLDALLLDMEIMALVEMQRGGDLDATIKGMHELYAAGRKPDDKARTFLAYWYFLTQHADRTNDLALFREAWGNVRPLWSATPG